MQKSIKDFYSTLNSSHFHIDGGSIPFISTSNKEVIWIIMVKLDKKEGG